MAKKSVLPNIGSLIGSIKPYGDGEAESGRPAMVVLQSIRLDPGQPRHLLPASLARQIYSGQATLVQVMQEWAKQANFALVPEVPVDEPVPDGWLAQRLQRIQELAANIVQLGLIHPVNVVPQTDGTYLLETGERRVLAMAWLVACGLSEYERVPVLFVSQSASHRSRQMIENISREDLSAVEKARGLWNIRYEISGVSGPDWDRLMGSDRLSDMLEKSELVPWTEVQRQLSIGKRYRIWLTQTLELAPEAIAIIEQYGLPERATRALVQFLREDPQGQVTVLKTVVSERSEDEGLSVRVTTEYVESVVKQYMAVKARTKEGKGTAKNALSASERPGYESRLLLTTKRMMRSLHRVMGTKPLSKKTLSDITKGAATDSELAELARQVKPLVDALAVLSPEPQFAAKKQKHTNLADSPKGERKGK